jgi:membrane fusion protein (multidrug efflux system)
MRVTTAPVTLFDEYAAQAEAVQSVEIRPRVGGTLERQGFRDGAMIKRSDLLFVIDQQPYISALAQAKANLAQAEASYLNSQQNLVRLRPLSASRAISPQELDAAIAKERADAASVQAGRAQVRQAQLNLDYTTIRAPRDGVIGKALIKPGGLVNASSTLLTTLYSVDPIYVSFTISEQKLNELQKRYDIGIAGSKTPDIRIKLIDGSDYKHSGKLNFLSPAVDPRNGTLPVRLIVPNPDGTLRDGQFVRAVVPAQENPNAILVPQKAVQELQGKRSVFVIGPDNKATYRDITANARVGPNWVVEKGVQPGDLIVVEGIGKIKPGVVVKPVPVDQVQDGVGKAPPQATKGRE